MITKSLSTLGSTINRHAWQIVIGGVLLALLSSVLAVTTLETQMGTVDLISPHTPAGKRYLEYIHHFGTPEVLLILLKSPQPEQAIRYAEQLAMRLRKQSTIVKQVEYKIDLTVFKSHALWYLEIQRLQNIFHYLRVYAAQEQRIKQQGLLFTLLSQIDTQLQTTPKQSPDLAALSGLASIIHSLAQEQPLRLPQAPPTAGYYFARDQSFLLMLVHPISLHNDFKLNQRLITTVQAISAELQPYFPHVTIGLTGSPALSYDHIITSRQDLLLSSVLSLLAVSLIFILGFYSLRYPLMAVLALVMAIAVCSGCVALLIGHLTMLSMPFVVILIGLGIDFGIHLISRYQEQRQQLPPPLALHQALPLAGKGILTGALTTASAFYGVAWLSEFKGFSELGVIVGTGILLCAIASLILLPALLLLVDSDRLHAVSPAPLSTPLVSRWPRSVLAVSLVVTCLAASAWPWLRFDTNLLNLQARGTPSVQYILEVQRQAPHPIEFAALMLPPNYAHKQRLVHKLQRLSSVRAVRSLEDYLPNDQLKKQELLAKIRQQLPAKLSQGPCHANLIQPLLSKLSQRFKYFSQRLPKASRFLLGNLKSNLNQIQTDLVSMQAQLSQNSTMALHWQQRLYQAAVVLLDYLQQQSSQPPLTGTQLPHTLRRRFRDQQGQELLQIIPRNNIWQTNALDEFVKQIQAVAPNVTGHPVMVWEMMRQIKNGYYRALWVTFLVIILLLWIDLRAWHLVLMAIVPLICGILWLGGLMVLSGIAFNAANLIVLPLILGIGIDHGVHLAHRLQEKQVENLLYTSTSRAILLSSLTTMASFGTLALSHHRGTASLGYVLTLGVGCCLLAALVIFPAMITLMTKSYSHD